MPNIRKGNICTFPTHQDTLIFSCLLKLKIPGSLLILSASQPALPRSLLVRVRTVLPHTAAPTTGQPRSQLGLLDTTEVRSSKRVRTAETNLCLQGTLTTMRVTAQDASTEERAILDQRTTKDIEDPHRDCKQEQDPGHVFFRVLGERQQDQSP